MSKQVAIIGAGINGVLCAFLLAKRYPELTITVFDSGADPREGNKHRGVTLGSKDARHITGSESISFESSIHKNALRNTPSHAQPGWLLTAEGDLRPSEHTWRAAFEQTYAHGHGLNPVDYEHAQLNYRGLSAWMQLVKEHPFIADFLPTTDIVEVFFGSEEAFISDLRMETDFCQRFFPAGQVATSNNTLFKNLHNQTLHVPGVTVRIRSLTLELLNTLDTMPNVDLQWSHTITDASQLTHDIRLWTAGVTHSLPDSHAEHLIQGIIGCWITVSNTRSLTQPFKVATPAPSAYINFTPEGDELHISGGFGWVGENADFERSKKLAEPIAEHFAEQLEQILGIEINQRNISYCIRPSTPTGQPLMKIATQNGVTELFLSGSAKSGATHAPVLAEFAVAEVTAALELEE